MSSATPSSELRLEHALMLTGSQEQSQAFLSARGLDGELCWNAESARWVAFPRTPRVEA